MISCGPHAQPCRHSLETDEFDPVQLHTEAGPVQLWAVPMADCQIEKGFMHKLMGGRKTKAWTVLSMA